MAGGGRRRRRRLAGSRREEAGGSPRAAPREPRLRSGGGRSCRGSDARGCRRPCPLLAGSSPPAGGHSGSPFWLREAAGRAPGGIGGPRPRPSRSASPGPLRVRLRVCLRLYTPTPASWAVTPSCQSGVDGHVTPFPRLGWKREGWAPPRAPNSSVLSPPLPAPRWPSPLRGGSRRGPSPSALCRGAGSRGWAAHPRPLEGRRRCDVRTIADLL